MPSSQLFSRLSAYIFLNFFRTLTVLALLAGAASEMALLVLNLSERVANHILDDRFFAGSPGIPRAVGGTAGFAIGHGLSFIVLLAAALSETPMPKSLDGTFQHMWERLHSPFSRDGGVGAAGFYMVLLGALKLSQNVGFLYQVAGVVLVGLGIINVILGMTLGVSINYFRSNTYLTDLDDHLRLPPPCTASIGSSTKSSLSHSNNGSNGGSIVIHHDSDRWIRSIVPTFLRRMSVMTGSVYSAGSSEGVARGPISSPISIPSSAEWNDEDRSRLGPMVQIRR